METPSVWVFLQELSKSHKISLFSEQELICCICGTKYMASVNRIWHGFDQAVCGARCYYEKDWRRTLSIMGKPYQPDNPDKYDEEGRLKRK
jgi:hypothetical protein